MKRYEAVLSDLDGTIISPEMKVSPAVRETIRRLGAQATHLIPVTGRDYYDICDLARASGIEGPGVYSGGSTIVNTETGEHLWRTTIGVKLGREVVARVCNFAETVGFGKGRMSASTILPDMLEEAPLSIWVEFIEERAHEVDSLREHYAELTFHTSTYQNDGTVGLHITPAEIDKFTSTKKLLDMIGIDPSDTLAIGDGMNDLPLFALSDVSVAMGTAEARVKDAATYITGSVQEDGFSTAIEKYVIRNHFMPLSD